MIADIGRRAVIEVEVPDQMFEDIELFPKTGAEEGVAGIEIELDVGTLHRFDQRRQGPGGPRRGVADMDVVLDDDGDAHRRRQIGPPGDSLAASPRDRPASRRHRAPALTNTQRHRRMKGANRAHRGQK